MREPLAWGLYLVAWCLVIVTVYVYRRDRGR